MSAVRAKRGRHVAGGPSKNGAPALSKRATASTGRVLGLTVVDQGVSSLSNFALAGVVAHFSGPHELGVFAIMTATYIIGQGLVRSYTSDCMLTRHEIDDTLMKPYEQAGYLTALLASCGLSAMVIAVAVFLPHDIEVPLIVFAACFPFIALQDYSRYIGISRHQPGYAIGLDASWLILFLYVYFIEYKTGHTALPWLVGAWTGTGALVGLWTVPTHFPFRDQRDLLRFWFKSESSIGWRFAGQFLLNQSWAYAILYLLAFVLSVGAIGIFRLSQLAMGPVSVASVGLQSAMISMAAKKFATNPGRTLRLIFLVATGTAAVTAGWMFLVYFAPVHDVRQVLGPTWPQARSIFLYVGLGVTITAWGGAGAAGLRALRAAKESLWLAAALVPFLLVPAMVGANIDGLNGAAIGALISYTIVTVATWVVLIWATRTHHGDVATTDDVDTGFPPDPVLDASLLT